MKFDIKELFIFFLTFLGGNYIGNYIVEYFNLSNTTDLFYWLLAMFIPVAIIYMLWKNWGQKVASKK